MAIRKMQRGKWRAQLYVGRDEQRRRKYEYKTRATKREAQDWLDSRKAELKRLAEGKASAMPVSAFLDKWLHSCEGRLRHRTLASYASLLHRHVLPRIGKIPLCELQPLAIQAIWDGMRDAGLSGRTCEYAKTTFGTALRQAVKWRLLTSNPVDDTTAPRRRQGEVEIFTPDEVRRLLLTAELDSPRWFALFHVAVTSGARPSEYCGLRWSDLDWREGSIRITRSVEFLKGGGWQFSEPKTRSSRRTVFLHRSTIEALRTWQAEQQGEILKAGEAYTDNGLVFASCWGLPFRHGGLGRVLKRLLKLAGLPQRTLYSLRHTAASLALASGANIKAVSAQLGHSSAKMTLDVYAHASETIQREAVARAEAYMHGSSTRRTSGVPAEIDDAAIVV